MDESRKCGPGVGRFALPGDVFPMAGSYVARELVRFGGTPALGKGFTTDTGNVILDVAGFEIVDAPKLEMQIALLAGVVEVGLFARSPASVLLLGGPGGVREMTAS